MTRRFVALCMVSVLGVSCAASGGVPGADGPRIRAAGATGGTSVTPSPLPSPPPDEPAEPLPAPDEPVPTRRGELAQAFEQTFTRNRDAIAVWDRRADPATWPPPQDVVLLTKGQNNPAAKALMEFVRGPRGLQIIERYGYDVKK